MEITDFSQFGGINSIFSLIAMCIAIVIVYIPSEIYKWKKKKGIATEGKKDSSKTIDEIVGGLKSVEFLLMTHQFPEKKEAITNLYNECIALNKNGHITEVYQKWLKEN